ncbi:hypothetical protein EUX98_g2680 [Antrodiella citrinella]|uniref:G domain-containing protein n=1 Tax=Antrodiella citrinella TaxID=2447956 RepID=A0A4S4N0K5_9APHY|nr:hypothetical protein EUX98_g2680 [Antrodiella citrinella]
MPTAFPSPSMRQPKTIAIALMGATGTGKSTFVNLASGASLGVGDGLRSCTSEVATSHVFELFGRRIVLIDTPGFDDTTKSDTDILKMIAVYLASTYGAGVKLSGILYLHRISDFRMGGVNRRNFNMFRKLCGDETLKNVLLVTTMWSHVDLKTGESREEELRTDEILFKPVLDKGAQLVRHDNTLQSAQAILYRLIQNHPEPLRIQRELVDEKKDIEDTGAGEELARELAAVIRKHREELRAVQEEMNEAIAAKDMETKQELEEVRQKLVEDMMKVEAGRERLSREYATQKQEADEKLQEIQRQLENEARERARRQAELEKLQREFNDGRLRSEEEQRQLRERIEHLQRNPPRRGGFFGLVGEAFGALFSGHF